MSNFNAKHVPLYALAGLPKVYADRLPDEHGAEPMRALVGVGEGLAKILT